MADVLSQKLEFNLNQGCNLIRYFNDIALFKLYVHTISMQTGDHYTVTLLGDINTATFI